MNLLQRALIEKAGHDNGFEHVLPTATDGWLWLGSARHPTEVAVQTTSGGFAATLSRCQPSLPGELTRSFPESIQAQGPMGALFVLPTEDALARWLRRTAALAQALPDQAMTDFDAQVQAALAELEPGAAKSTEVLRLVRQRVGQQAFRHAMLDYWGGACAVTSVLAAGAACQPRQGLGTVRPGRAERLDVYNGFAQRELGRALFDTYLVTFDSTGTLQISELVSDVERSRLGLSNGMKLRWLDEKHKRYLEFQRSKCIWFSG